MSIRVDVMGFIPELLRRDQSLFVFGAVNFAAAAILYAVSVFRPGNSPAPHGLHKPIKFGLSIGVYSWTMGWYVHYLGDRVLVNRFNLGTILFLGFEIFYIAVQALRGQKSHYNVTTPVYRWLYALMGIAAALATVGTAIVGVAFCVGRFPELSAPYLWSIRIGILLFVVFSFEGVLMGARMSHTVGGADGSPGLGFVGWSKKFGDLRISHFLGMHALQAVPLSGYYVFESEIGVVAFGLFYFLVTASLLVVALMGRSIFRGRSWERIQPDPP